jgi:2-polyprenyl-6-methoxyphenol hydroxylase-like FAD-dependent oxidoreductase
MHKSGVKPIARAQHRILPCLLKCAMPSLASPFDVCIRGDGVVGRTLALLLAQARLRVALVGREPGAGAPEHTDVRAYALNTASRQTLVALRAWPDAAHATPVRQMQVRGDDEGRVDFKAPAQPATAKGSQGDALAWIVDVAPLHRLLVEAARFQPQIEIVAAPVAAALTVICEGQRANGHDELDVEWTVSPYPQDAIAARLESVLPHGGVARQWFGSGGDVLALLPMGGDAGHALALVWSLATERARQRLALSDTAFCAELETFCGAQTGNLRLISERASWPLALCQAGRWVGPGWALAGDAAHSVHPLAGQGLNLGLADAACLAKVLSEREYWRGIGDERLLRRYERARKGDTAAIAAVTDGLQGLFGQPGEVWQSLRNLGMNSVSRSGPIKSWLTRRAAGL